MEENAGKRERYTKQLIDCLTFGCRYDSQPMTQWKWNSATVEELNTPIIKTIYTTQGVINWPLDITQIN
jgi:hypothetical protein